MIRPRSAIAGLLITAACATVPPQDVRQASGKITLLRLEQRDSEGVIELDSEPGKTFRLQLLPGRDLAIREGMLDLLRDALLNDRTVTIGYRADESIVRASLSGTSPLVHVFEVPQLPATSADPILQGARLDPAAILDQFPDPPPEFADEGAHDDLDETKWKLVEASVLGPGQTREETVSFAEPALLQARATWFGSLGPVEMRATRDGTTLATGKVHPSQPDRGTVTLDVEIGSSGSATISIVNRGRVPVSVEMVIGTLPVSLRP